MSRPSKLSSVVGQNKTKQVLNTIVKSSIIRNEPCPHIIFYGPSGTGKTTLAKATAHELQYNYFEINGASIGSYKDLIPVIKQIRSLDTPSILFIDEIHAMSTRADEWFYTIMEDFRFANKKGVIVQCPRFTVIGATTELGALSIPLRNRFKYECEVEKYTLDELVEITVGIKFPGIKKLSKEVATIIAKTCRGVPRLVVNRTEFIRDYMLANKLSTISSTKILEILSLQKVDAEGLTDLDHRYLDIVKQGPTSLRILSAKLGVDDKTITNKIEPFLIEKDLIEITSSGRSYKDVNDDSVDYF